MRSGSSEEILMGIRSWLGRSENAPEQHDTKTDDDSLVSVSLSLNASHSFAIDDREELEKAVSPIKA
jgi:hypothetical protein